MRAGRIVAAALLALATSNGAARAGGEALFYAADGALSDKSVLPPEAVWADAIPGAAPWRMRRLSDTSLPACVDAGPPYSPECIGEAAIVGEIIEAYHGETPASRRLLQIKNGANIVGDTALPATSMYYRDAIVAENAEEQSVAYYKIDVWDPETETYSSPYHSWLEADAVITFSAGLCMPGDVAGRAASRQSAQCVGNVFADPFLDSDNRNQEASSPPHIVAIHASGLSFTEAGWREVVDLYFGDRAVPAFPDRWRVPICGTGSDRSFCASRPSPTGGWRLTHQHP